MNGMEEYSTVINLRLDELWLQKRNVKVGFVVLNNEMLLVDE
jgi:hypothetical protein